MTKGPRTLHLFLMLAAAGLALITVFTLAARLWWAFDLFSHFRLQYVVAALILSVAALAMRAYPSAAVLGVVALVHGWAIKDLWWGGTANAAQGGVPLRVVSANVLAPNPTPEKVLEFVRAADADLVVLVDARRDKWQPILSALRELYPYQSPKLHGGELPKLPRERPPVILFSRHPILDEELVRPPGGRRPYLLAEVAVGDQTVVVAGVHPSSPSPSEPGDTRRRNRELDHIAEIAGEADRPVIVAGDFNTTPWSPYFQDLVAAAGLRNAALGQGYIGTWPTWFWPALIPIDHVLLKGPLAATTVRRGPPIGSDHFPIIADLRLLSSAWLEDRRETSRTGISAERIGGGATAGDRLTE
jgi:endonuclease/exonuclease/phosphatase (EEP) superfamily protein YafD